MAGLTPYTIDSKYTGGFDVPIDGGVSSNTLIFLQILWELRAQSVLLQQIINGESKAGDLDALRFDESIDPHFNGAS